MMLILTLRFDREWIAENSVISVKGNSLEDLDRKLKYELKKVGYSGKIEVLMRFDYSTIPRWMRQFHPHYFNRRVVIDV